MKAWNQRTSKKRRRTFPVALIITVLVGLAAVWLILSEGMVGLPDPRVLERQYPVTLYGGQGQPFTVRLVQQKPRNWASLREISRKAIGAIIVSEDWAFFSHEGYDLNQIQEVVGSGIRTGRIERGASTITQQVAKNVFLSHERTFWRKIQELILAVRLERSLSKPRILEIYLNIAEWGEGLFGIHRAARFYFGKHPAHLTAKEGAFLAMLLPSPRRYSISFRQEELTPYGRKTVDSILHKMVKAGYLEEEERIGEAQRLLPFEKGIIEEFYPEQPAVEVPPVEDESAT
jgi:monofunctional glycosyltransferase